MPDSKRYVLWGSAGHAKVLSEIIGLQGGRVIALFDNSDVPSALPGVPMYLGAPGFQNWVDAQSDLANVLGLAAIGGARGRDRLAIQTLFLTAGLKVPVLVHPAAVVSTTALLGSGTQVLALAQIAPDVRLGRACIVNHRVSIDHECVIGHGVHIAPSATLCGCVHISDGAFIGASAVVLPRLRIGSNAIIGAGAVVTRNVPDGAKVVGNPARCVGACS